MSREPLQPQDKYVLRMPDGMRDRIKAAAEKNNRSMNAEIIANIEQSGEIESLRAALAAKEEELKNANLRRQAAFEELMLRVDLDDITPKSNLLRFRQALNNREALMTISESATKALVSAQEVLANLGALIARYAERNDKIDPKEIAADFLRVSGELNREKADKFWNDIIERYEIRADFWKDFVDEIEAIKARKAQDLIRRAKKRDESPPKE